MEKFCRTIFGFWALAFILIASPAKSQTPGGANGMVFRFTKQVWLNPTIILAKQNFEQSTNVKLLILPRVNGDDTTGSSRIEKAFDKLLSFLVFKENVQGSIKFYFNPKNTTKPFTFNTSDELHCKFTPIQKDSVETILNKDIVNSSNLNTFTALPFDSIISRASRYCKRILQSKPGPCGENPGNEFTLTKINSTPAKLNFEKGMSPNPTAPNGGVDAKKYPELEQYYNTVLDVADNSNYPLSWKAMAANTSDVVKLKLKKKQSYFDISKLVFKNANGTETYNVTYSNINRDSVIDLSISGKSPGSMTEVVAYYTPTTTPTQTFAIGAFNVQFYEPKTLNVVLVNLGGITLPDANAIKDTLNKIYGQAFVKWNVTTVNYTLPGTINKTIHVESSSLLSNYMPDMQPIVSSFKDNCTAYNGSSDNTYYLLFGTTNDADLLGYMPRARNTGFIFSQNNVTAPADIVKAMPRTIAHELGHGAFNLKHIFDSDELGGGSKQGTDNLMDYVLATRLYKHQWDLIHNPGFVSWFDGDDEEAAASEPDCPGNIDFQKVAALYSQTDAGSQIEDYAKELKDFCPGKLLRLNSIQRVLLINLMLKAPTHNVSFIGNIGGYSRQNYTEDVELCLQRLFQTAMDKKEFWSTCKQDATFISNSYKLFLYVDDGYYQEIIKSLCDGIEKNRPYVKNISYTSFLSNGLFAHYKGNNALDISDLPNHFVEFDATQKKYILKTFEREKADNAYGVNFKKIEKPLNTDDFVVLYSESSIPYLENQTSHKVKLNLVPVIYLYFLENYRKQSGDDPLFDVGVGILTSFLGASGVASEARMIFKFVAFADFVSSTSMVVMKTGNLRSKLQQHYGTDGTQLYDEIFGSFEDIQKVSAAIDFTRLLSRIGSLQTLYQKIKNQFKNDPNFTTAERKFIEDASEAGAEIANTSRKLNVLSKLNNLPDATRFVNSLDDTQDAALLGRLDNLSQSQLDNLDALYKSLDHPTGFAGQLNYSATKVIEGQNVTIIYRKGFPDFIAYSPQFNFPNRTGKFKFQSNGLNGGSTDFGAANTALANEFGIQKISNQWPKDPQGYVTSGNYRWKPGSQPFEMRNASGGWDQYTWHHFEDGRTMIPVKTSVHSKSVGGFNHSGGKSIITNQLQDLFEFLAF